MTELIDPNLSRLKHHFAQRVINQSRQVLDVWQYLQRSEWSEAGTQKLVEANALLMRYAERFEQTEHHQLASHIAESLQAVSNNRSRLNSLLIGQLNHAMQRLSCTGLRHGDKLEQNFIRPLQKPVYIALHDYQRGIHLAQQLQSFGLSAQAVANMPEFHSMLSERHPAAIVIDVDFAGAGVALVESVQQHLEQKIPLLFFSHHEPDTHTRLAAVRAGGQDFFTGSLDASSLLERIEILTHVAQYDPYRVLIIDDSKAQAIHTERTFNSAGILTRTLTEPMLAMDVLSEFQPDLVILDMYMPDCNGAELAKVIRHNERYVSVPIIFLSAEDDLDKQLDAMSEGGDDFLTKPIKPRHLIATVRNRAARARSLKARMVRDSLTGLYNHTHTLQLLEDACFRAHREQQPLAFAMLDIDFFKKVNDTYGHPMGDRVIKSLALFLKQRLRKTDYIGRYGGEEFAVILPDTSAADALKVLNEIRQRFAEICFPAHPHDLRCTFSCGIAELNGDRDVSQLSKTADEALYVAKNNGRNQVQIAAS